MRIVVANIETKTWPSGMVYKRVHTQDGKWLTCKKPPLYELFQNEAQLEVELKEESGYLNIVEARLISEIIPPGEEQKPKKVVNQSQVEHETSVSIKQTSINAAAQRARAQAQLGKEMGIVEFLAQAHIIELWITGERTKAWQEAKALEETPQVSEDTAPKLPVTSVPPIAGPPFSDRGSFFTACYHHPKLRMGKTRVLQVLGKQTQEDIEDLNTAWAELLALIGNGQ